MPTDYSHEAFFYESTDEFVDVLGPVVKNGCAAGDRVVAFAPTDRLRALRSVLTPGERSAVEMRDSAELYTNPARTLTGYHRMLRDQARTGRPIRLVGEQPLHGRSDEQVRQWCRVDAAFDGVCAFPRTQVICPYGRSHLPRWVLDHVERSHQMVGSWGEWRPSPSYVSSEHLLAEELARTVLEPPSEPVSTLVAPEDAHAARRFIEVAATAGGMRDSALEDFRLATGEAVANAYQHATIEWVRVWMLDGDVVCEVRDRGAGIRDPLAGYRQPEPTQIAGRGLWLAHQLCDQVKIQSGAWGTTIRLYKATGR